VRRFIRKSALSASASAITENIERRASTPEYE
jgi:hypothetical protein